MALLLAVVAHQILIGIATLTIPALALALGLAFKGVQVHSSSTSTVSVLLGCFLFGVTDDLGSNLGVAVQLGYVELEVVLKPFRCHPHDDHHLLLVLKVLVSPGDIFGDVSLPTVNGCPQVVQSAPWLNKDFAQQPHIAPWVVRLIQVAKLPPGIQSTFLPGIEYHRVWHLTCQRHQSHMQVAIQCPQLRHCIGLQLDV